MKKINDNFYFNSNSISALYLANAVVTVILADGDEVTIDDDTFNAIAEDISSFKVNDNLYINPAQIVAMTFFDGEYHIVLVNDIRLELSEAEITNLVGNDYINKVNDNLYINPNHVVGLASANGNRIITMVDNIRFEVSEEEYTIVSEIEPVTTGTGENVVLPYGQTNPDLYQYQLIADNTNIEIDCSKLADYFEKNVDRDDVMDISSWAGDSDSSHNEIVVFHPICKNGSSCVLLADSEGLLKLSLEATSGGTLFEVTLGDSENYSSPLEALRNAGIITINNNMVEEYNPSHATYLPLVVYSIQACDTSEEIANLDFIRIYNV